MTRLTTQELAVFFRQFAALLKAGIPILQVCHSLQKSQRKPHVQKLIHQIKNELLAGNNLSVAFRKCTTLTPLTQQLIFIGEKTGQLDEMLESVATHYESLHQFHLTLKQALFYPICVLFVASLVVTLMFCLIIPKFAELFQQLNTPLPFYTQIIFIAASFFQSSVMMLLPIFTICFLYFIYKRHFFIKMSQFISSRIPLIRDLSTITFFARLSRLLSLTLQAGIPLDEALKLIAMQSSQPKLTHLIWQTRSDIYSGLSLHASLAKHTMTPDILLTMVKVGEESGQLASMLLKTAQCQEEEVSRIIKRALTLLEPLIMLLLGVLIGGLVLAMYLPIFNLGNAF